MKRAALLVLGAYVCLVSSVVHRHVWRTGDVQWPWAVVLAVGSTYVLTRAAQQLAPVGGAWLGLGWGLALMAQQLAPGGDYLVGSDWLGWSFTLGCLGAIVLGVVRPPRLRQ